MRRGKEKIGESRREPEVAREIERERERDGDCKGEEEKRRREEDLK